MATYIKNLGCDCDCGTLPCESGCACVFLQSDTGSGALNVDYDVTGQFVTSGVLNVAYTLESDGSTLRVLADGVPIMSSGCRLDMDDDYIYFVPAGTVEITVEIVVSDCASVGGGTFCNWSYYLECV